MPPRSLRENHAWFSTMPCVIRRVNGSSNLSMPMSRMTLVQKRA
jgi:hypothetical protein